MKKLMLVVAVLVLGLAAWPSGVMAESIDTRTASDYAGIYVSRISADDKNEWVEIHNTYDYDVNITTLELDNYNGSGNLNPATPISLKSGVFRADSYILIKQTATASGDFDYGYSGAIIPKTSGGMKLFVNGVKTSDFCWGSWKGSVQVCQVSGLTFLGKFSSLADDGAISVNECELTDQVDGCSINNFPMVTFVEPYQPRFGGFVPDFVEPEDPPPVDPGDDPDTPPQFCAALQLSEISTNEQWIELYNNSDATVAAGNLAGCVLSVQYGDKTPPNLDRYKLALDQYLGETVVAPYGYLAIDVSATDGISLPKSVTNRLITIHDADSDYSEAVYGTQKSGTTLAYFADGWKVTFAPTMAAENIYQQYQTCDVGKHINEATGNCVKDPDPPVECADGQFRNPLTGRCKKIATDTGLADCPDGQYRNPLTNRCKKIAEPTVLADCPDGQFRNPATNRCKKIATTDDLKPCAEGYERNPATNRCRKIVSTGAATFAVQPTGPTGGGTAFQLVGAGVLAATAGIVLLQFRMEITRRLRRLIPKRARIST